MDFSGRYRIVALPQQVWDSLDDPEILQACLPSCEQFERIAANEFQGSAVVRTGFMKASFHGKLVQLEATPPTRCVLQGYVQGGAAGSVKGEVRIVLQSQGANTVLDYAGRAEIEGKMAQMGQRAIHGILKQVADEFFMRLQSIMTERHAPLALATPPDETDALPSIQGPTRDASPPEIWVVGLIGVVVIILVLFGLTL